MKLLSKQETGKVHKIITETLNEFERIGIQLQTGGRRDVEAVEDACYRMAEFDIEKYYNEKKSFRTVERESSFQRMKRYQTTQKNRLKGFKLRLSIDYDTLDLEETTVRIDDDIQYIQYPDSEWEEMMKELGFEDELNAFKLKKIFNPEESFGRLVNQFREKIDKVNRMISSEVETEVKKILSSMEKRIKNTQIKFD